jgi:hypothetical protein
MKTIKSDLNLDFIGGQGSLTKAEEKQLSDYFKSKKLINKTDKALKDRKVRRPTIH